MAAMPDLVATDLEVCLRGARDGSSEAVTQLFERCRDYLLYIASRELSPDLRAKVGPSDLVQESLMKAHRDFGDFRGCTEAELLAWLRQILLRCYLDVHRRFKVSQRRTVDREVCEACTHGIAAPSETPSVQLATGEQYHAIEGVLRNLPEDYRTVIQQRIWEKRSFVDIALEMNRSPEAVRKLWFRGVDQLRRNWQETHGGAGQ